MSRVHQQDGVAGREATLQIVAAERRKTLDSNFASGGKYQTNVRLTLWDGEHTMAGVVDTRATAAAEDIWAVGNVIRIRNFTCLPYSPGDDTSVYKIELLFHDVRFLEARLVERRTLRRVRAAAAVAATTRPTSPVPVSTMGAFARRRAAGPAGAASGRESRVVVAPPTMRMSVFRLPPPLLLLVLVARSSVMLNARAVTKQS